MGFLSNLVKGLTGEDSALHLYAHPSTFLVELAGSMDIRMLALQRVQPALWATPFPIAEIAHAASGLLIVPPP